MKIGDKVKHANTGDKIHTVKNINGNVCICILDESMWFKLTSNSKSGLIINTMVTNIENLTKQTLI